MSLAVVVALCFFQAPGLNSPERLQREVLAWQTRHMAESAPANQPAMTREAVYEEQQFVSKFNHLLNTLREFTDQYNRHVLDVKKIKALKKAWRDLEKTDAWFRFDEASGR